MAVPIPFSQIFAVIQRNKVPSKKKYRVFYGEMPKGHIGFLYQLSSDKKIPVSWFIDGEEVQDNVELSGEMFNPPYVIKKYIEVITTNSSDEDVVLEVSCDGDYYMDIVKLEPAETPQPEPEKTKEGIPILQPVKRKKEITDEVVNASDQVYMLYDEAQKGLNWDSCNIINRGPNDVYLTVNEWKRPSAPLSVGESMNVDLDDEGSIKRLYFICNEGETASVKIHALKTFSMGSL